MSTSLETPCIYIYMMWGYVGTVAWGRAPQAGRWQVRISVRLMGWLMHSILSPALSTQPLMTLSRIEACGERPCNADGLADSTDQACFSAVLWSLVWAAAIRGHDEIIGNADSNTEAVWVADWLHTCSVELARSELTRNSYCTTRFHVFD
jgi:hypothetical protein